MKKRAVLLTFILVSAFGFVPAARGAQEALPKPMELLEESQKSFDGLQDYTAVFVKHQRIRGRLRKPETIFMKFKKPFAIYMKWIKVPDEGKEVIYVDGKNDNKLAGHPGGFLYYITPTMYLEPQNPIAMGGNLKPINQAGLGKTIEALVKICKLAEQNGDLALVCKGTANFEGRDVYVVERFLPPNKSKEYPNAHAVIYIDKQLKLPVYYASYDEKEDLLEEYIYRDVKLNVGLNDNDFSVSNPEYEFKKLFI